MGKYLHRLSNKDPETKTAFCEKCGVVSIKWKDNIWRCSIGIKERKGPGGDYKKKKRPHGLTLYEAEDFKKGKSCEICGSDIRLVVDHCHSKLKIRGVLCAKCNTGLGMFSDDIGRLSRAILYLQESRKD